MKLIMINFDTIFIMIIIIIILLLLHYYLIEIIYTIILLFYSTSILLSLSLITLLTSIIINTVNSDHSNKNNTDTQRTGKDMTVHHLQGTRTSDSMNLQIAQSVIPPGLFHPNALNAIPTLPRHNPLEREMPHSTA